jgi:hypothetical protein
MVKLYELDQRLKNMEDIDLVDDLHFFMNNDPKFYRRIMYPVLSQMKHKVEKGQKCNHKMFNPCVDTAAKIYCKKFNIPDDDRSVFTDVDRDSLARKIFQQESDNIKKGIYGKEQQ